jgi:ribosomal protein L1
MAKKKETAKITEEELKNVQMYVNALQQLQTQIGSHEMAKYEMMENVKAVRAKLTEVQKGLEETYGDVSINLQDGTITSNDAGNS